METTYRILHMVLVIAYCLAPVAALALTAVHVHRRYGSVTATLRPYWSVATTLIAGFLIGLGLTLVYAFMIAGTIGAVQPTQALLAGAFGMGLLALLKGFDALVRRGIRAVRRRGGWTGRSSAAVGALVRVVLLVLVGLPFVMAAVMTYRPKVVPPANPLTDLRLPFERAEFEADDGTELVGWWIPAVAGPVAQPGPAPEMVPGEPFPAAEATVVIVHGLGSGKADLLPMAGDMHAGGYNVLIFDLRAHGESGGQFTSFGMAEQADVLAAAEWVRRHHPQESRRLLALGTSMGAAAMVGARDEQGRTPFDALAVMGTYDDLGELAEVMVSRQFVGPLGWIARQVAIPAASVHAGQAMNGFRPGKAAAGLWPQPLLVIHARNDQMIPFEFGRRLYEQAYEPKRRWWVERGGHNRILVDPSVMQVVLEFFNDARSAPENGVV